MTEFAHVPRTALDVLRLTDGLVVHHALCAVATLGVADLLAAGPRTTDELSIRLGVHSGALYRTMRFIAGYGVFEERGARTFANNAPADYLRTDVPDSVRAALVFRGRPFFTTSVSSLLDSVRSGRPACDAVLGTSAFDYLRAHPDERRVFDEGMTAISRVWAPAVAHAYDFGQWESITDVGGGNGLLLAAILRAHTALAGVLADVPSVAAAASEAPHLRDLTSRTRVVACDFFHQVPSGTRAYVMKNILHDWSDEQARTILRCCRRAVPADGALLIVEYAVGGPNTPSVGKMVDLVMLTLMGGQERTLEEHRALLATAGFAVHATVAVTDDILLIEARPVAETV